MRWKPWTVQVVGRETGEFFELPFVRFWTQQRANLWCITVNAAGRSVSGQPEEGIPVFFRSCRFDRALRNP